ncbi:phage integrase SAM-like domain-containing protein [Parafilimonas sp.]|uniref:site-specific integrase n=1 Tax=Parafilimonas sp. TaxID=1969739 RepID=UPI0039E4E4A8
MRQPIKLIVKKGKLRSDGTRLISIQYCHSATKRAVVGTGIAIPPQYWNKKSCRISGKLPPQYGNVEDLEKRLTDKLRKAEDMVKSAKKRNICPIKFLHDNLPLSDKWTIEQMKDHKDELDVFRQIDLYIEERKSEVSQSTISVISTMKEHLRCFETYRKENIEGFKNTPITFDSFDFDFYTSFLKYLTYEYQLKRKKEVIKGLRINALGKTIKWLKIFLTNRINKKIIPPIDLSAYKSMEEEVDAIYLSWAEISAIYKLDLSAYPIHEKIRDEFVLGCLTGFRFSDYSKVKPEEIRDGMLFVTQTKTSDRVVVPLRPTTEEILKKYNMQMPPISNPDFNLYIKEVASMAGINQLIKFTYKRGNKMVEEIRPKYAWVMSHTCRRSFCTNEFLDGTPIILIMAISGHKTERAFRRYIRADALQKAQMIKKIWDNRPVLVA